MNKIILVYHSIGNDDKFLQVPMDSFIKQIDAVLRKYKPQRLNAFLSAKEQNKNEVLIMFDDAFYDAIPAMDYLDEKGIPFSVAVADVFLETQGYCSLTDLNRYRNAEFVFHTRTHKDLSGLSENEIEEEITPLLACELPIENGVMVYPNGVYDTNVLRVMKKKNYVWGLTCLPFHFTEKYKNKPFEVPRININGYLPFWKFRFYLTPLGNAYLHAAFIKRRITGENYLDK